MLLHPGDHIQLSGGADEDFSPLCCASYHSFQEQSYSIFVMSDWYSVECISCHIVRSLLIFQGEFIGCECSNPVMSCSIQVRCCQHVCQWIVVHMHCKQSIGQIIFKMFSDAPLQCQDSSLEL